VVLVVFAHAVLHYPRLDTVLMVEDKIRESKRDFTRTELWESLPKQMQYQTFQVILEYLEKSNKITFDKGVIVWIASNPKLDSVIKRGKEY
jgi:hypothetical protein